MTAMPANGGYTDKDVMRFRENAANGKLSTRDRKFINQFKISDEEIIADMITDISSANLKELSDTIANTKSPEIKAILTQEQDRLYNIVGQVAEARKSRESADSTATATTAATANKNQSNSLLDQFSNFLSNIWGAK